MNYGFGLLAVPCEAARTTISVRITGAMHGEYIHFDGQ